MSARPYLRLHGPIRLAGATVECWRCHEQTAVHALEVSDVEDVDEGGDVTRLGSRAFVYGVGKDDLAGFVRLPLAQHAPKYLPTFSRTTGETSWASLCEHCDALQGAFFQHSEPDGPFFGGPKTFKGSLTLLSTEGIEVQAASYSM